MKLHIKIITSIIKAILNVKNGKDFESDSINVYLLSDVNNCMLFNCRFCYLPRTF
jgi:hypothetical protein